MSYQEIQKLSKPPAGSTWYCNCQKTCFPCSRTAVVLANTEDGSLQLCPQCKRGYEMRVRHD